MTRAVIELNGDISPAMPQISKLIEGCAYSPEGKTMAFRIRDMRVIVEHNKVTIYNPENESIPGEIMKWLTALMSRNRR